MARLIYNNTREYKSKTLIHDQISFLNKVMTIYEMQETRDVKDDLIKRYKNRVKRILNNGRYYTNAGTGFLLIKGFTTDKDVLDTIRADYLKNRDRILEALKNGTW